MKGLEDLSMSKEEAREKGISQFFNLNPIASLQIKDAGGAVTLGPFLPGTEKLGPWYNIDELTDSRFRQWQRDGKIGLRGQEHRSCKSQEQSPGKE